ncbi:CvpA family protein [bacterium]|nr:CvpA family protein [bacterium]
MNGLDLALLVVLSISAIIGLWKGITRGIFSLIAIITGVVISSKYYLIVSIALHNYIKSSLWSNIVSFIIILTIITLIISLMGTLVKRLMGILALGWIDHLGGLAFGVVRGILIGGLVIMMMNIFPIEEGKKVLAKSTLSPHLLQVTKNLLSLLPEEFCYPFKDYL